MRVALVGNQNSGKTSLFNCLTGSNQKVGNWPGVTIDRKEGVIKGTETILVDLPGIYSLSPYTSEEEVSRKYILEENPDVIISDYAIDLSKYFVKEIPYLFQWGEKQYLPDWIRVITFIDKIRDEKYYRLLEEN